MVKVILWEIASLAVVVTSAHAYSLTFNADASNFFTQFNFFNGADPTKGFVRYASQGEAQSSGMAGIVNNRVYLGVDNTTVVRSTSSAGRGSVRLESTQTFSNGILITDFAHLPGSVCGTWPAYWTINELGHPYGEIDIIEGVNDQTFNMISLHTSNACSLTGGTQTGTDVRTNCSGDDTGCGVSGDSTSYGSGFNTRGGGVYALYLEESLKIWIFHRSAIPSDITNGHPDPRGWGTPLLDFEPQASCSVAPNFGRQTIIFNIDFCGSNAGGRGWTDWSDCPKMTGVKTCESYVAANPSAYSDSYFLINSVKVYQ